MRLSHPMQGTASHHNVRPADGRRAFTARHAVLIALLVGIGVLVRADEAVPYTARVPGIVILAALSLWLLLGSLRTRSGRRA